jgi:hypothetical protein
MSDQINSSSLTIPNFFFQFNMRTRTYIHITAVILERFTLYISHFIFFFGSFLFETLYRKTKLTNRVFFLGNYRIFLFRNIDGAPGASRGEGR